MHVRVSWPHGEDDSQLTGMVSVLRSEYDDLGQSEDCACAMPTSAQPAAVSSYCHPGRRTHSGVWRQLCAGYTDGRHITRPHALQVQTSALGWPRLPTSPPWQPSLQLGGAIAACSALAPLPPAVGGYILNPLFCACHLWFVHVRLWNVGCGGRRQGSLPGGAGGGDPAGRRQRHCTAGCGSCPQCL